MREFLTEAQRLVAGLEATPAADVPSSGGVATARESCSRLAAGTMLVVTHPSSDTPIRGAPMPVPGAPVDPTVAPQPVREVARPAWFTLMAPGWMPPAGQVTQALGICVTADGRVVMVTWDDEHWTFPGGSIEPGETVEQALVREVAEEACVRVVACEYLACQHVADPLNPGVLATLFWQEKAIARRLLDSALAADRRHRAATDVGRGCRF